ncbi:hypothetical protein [Lutibacter maritimus]|uniref:Uncharacterized protein n=1 Tax=Lutibacter maritimus TaxID=593133 RepID=A0A1I6RFF1_9FLAO|nr:hypothetical protein [Lutibacter maritimus]SFS63198.1 hypothetical protein SAMN04488006_2399 [Lutibacter maritimus]
MTLIIGCITPEYGIIAGDTQLTTTGLDRDEKDRLSTQIKLKYYYPNFMTGILGKWSWFSVGDNGIANYINEYENLINCINPREVENKLDGASRFLIGREKIDATLIYIKKENDDLELNAISNNGCHKDLKRLEISNSQYLFNEPFNSLKDDLVTNIIYELIGKYNLTESLLDNLFLINNAILKLITLGKTLDISNKTENVLGVKNTVGGYVTIQVLQMNKTFNFNYLFQPYSSDFNCLLDKTSNPFSNYINCNSYIRYIDNLGMIFKKIKFPECADLKNTLIELGIKQINYISENNILIGSDLNEIINVINKKYDLSIPTIEIKIEDSESEFIGLNLVLDVEENNVNIEYLKRFI